MYLLVTTKQPDGSEDVTYGDGTTPYRFEGAHLVTGTASFEDVKAKRASPLTLKTVYTRVGAK
jgi:hypothetical protein